MLQLNITSISGKIETFEFENQITVEKLKEELENKCGCKKKNLTIISSNKETELKNNENIDFTDNTLTYLVNEKKTFKTKKELQIAISNFEWNKEIINIYGIPNEWDVSDITDMSKLFWRNTIWNEEIGNWDVSQVTNMSRMFEDAHKFNQDISGWDVGSVTNMEGMFYNALIFNKPLYWNVSNVYNMSYMFENALLFNQKLSWNVSKVWNMRYMFHNAQSFNKQLIWDVSKVTDMKKMFYNAESFNKKLDWNVNNVDDMKNMFCFTELEKNNNLPKWYK